MIRRSHIASTCLILALSLMTACGAQPDRPVPSTTPAALGTPETTAVPGSRPTSRSVLGTLVRTSATPTVTPLTVARNNELPADAELAVLKVLVDAGLKPVSNSGESDIDTRAEPSSGDKLAYEHILVPVDRFPSTLEALTSESLRDVWTGKGTSRDFTTIYPSQDAVSELEALLGPRGPSVKPQAPDDVGSAVWGDPMSIGIVPFDALTPRLRALDLDGASVVDNRLAPGDWPLAARAWLHPRTERGRRALQQAHSSLPTTNRDPDRLTVVAMGGVTALARNTASAIERAGDYAYPARVVGPGLAAADLTITSNEIPFVEGCIADNSVGTVLFCAKPEYYAALELSGVDAVGLTGNHLNDFGYENFLTTLDFYQAQGLPVYGGGADDEAARAPLILEHNGNRLAFLGANQFGPAEYQPNGPTPVSAWAGSDHPGAAPFDLVQMIADIEAVRSRADLVFAEVQHTEFNAAGEYQTEPLPEQMADFEALKDAGADVVTGVQAHAPQAIELRGDGVILYGLGNLYFDQTWSWPTSTGLVAWHTVYEGRLLNTHLSVTVIDANFQVRWATPEERREVLRNVYGASGW